MTNALIGAVVGVHKSLMPLPWQRGGINGKAVILAGDVATAVAGVGNRLVVGAVAEFHLKIK